MANDKKAKKDDRPGEDKPKDDKSKGANKAGAAAEEKDDAGGAEAAEAVKASTRFPLKKILLFVGLPLLLMIAIGAGAYFMGFIPTGPHLNCAGVKEGDKDFAQCSAMQEAADAGKPAAFLEIPDMIVNLNSPSKQPRFLKISLKLELDTAEDQKKMEPLLPRVVDQFQMYLRELRIEDLRGTSGIYRLKIELLSRVRAAAPNIRVRDVLFQEILVQ
jgi:flagellar FliL protein